MHMLRVAAVATLICDSMSIEVDKENIVLACLFHDMGNIIKSELDYFPDMVEPEGLEYWQKVRKEFIDKYGKDEHNAVEGIAGEIGLSDKSQYIMKQDRFSWLCRNRDSDDFNVKIIQYSDYRVGPYGVFSFDERMKETKKRYGKQNIGREAEREKFVACGVEIEKQIFAHTKIKPEDITDEAIAPVIEKLRDFVIK